MLLWRILGLAQVQAQILRLSKPVLVTIATWHNNEQVSNLVFYTQSTITAISGHNNEQVTWCFTPSQPLQLYQDTTMNK